MSSLAVSHILPGGTAPGTAVATGCSPSPESPAAPPASAWPPRASGSAVVLNAIFWLALLISIPLTGFNPLYGFAAIAGVILLGLFAGTVLLLTRGKHAAAHHDAWPSTSRSSTPTRSRRWSRRWPTACRSCWTTAAAPPRPRAGPPPTGSSTRRLCGSSSWPSGKSCSPIDLLVAYGLANVLAVIPITPGGLGVVEGVLIPTLAGLRRPRAIAILGVLPGGWSTSGSRSRSGGSPTCRCASARAARRRPPTSQRPGAGPAIGPTGGLAAPVHRRPRRRSAAASRRRRRLARARSRRRRRPGEQPSSFDAAALTPRDGGDALPAPVGPERPGVGVVGQIEVEHLEQPGLELGVVYRRQHLDAAVEVALHQVGRADEQPEGQGRRLVGDRPPRRPRRSGRCASARGTGPRSSAPGSSRRARAPRAAGSTGPAR